MNLIVFLNEFVDIFFNLLYFAIIVRIFLSWMPSGGNHRLKEIVYSITEPVLGPFRRVIPKLGMLDISPIVAMFVIDFVRSLLLILISRL